MSAKDLEILEKELRPLVGLIGMIKAMVATSVACVLFIIAGAVWVTNQTSAIASNASDVRTIMDDRKSTLAEWTVWRRDKDATITKIVVIAENQQRLLESHQRWMEKQRDRE